MNKEKLALYGGKPVRSEYLPYSRQTIDEHDVAMVSEVLRSDWLTQGPSVREFENRFAEYIGMKHAVAFANGTAALHASIFAADIGTGDEVIVPAITFAATSNAALYQGATPIFADIDPETGLIDIESINMHVSDKTKAIIPVHYAGLPVEMEPLLVLAKMKNVLVIEDACHAVGATYQGRPAGSFGDMACFSFHPVKPITTGEGGMVVTNSDKYAAKLRAFVTHGIVKSSEKAETIGGWFYEMVELGYNYRLTDIQSILGISQLAKADVFLADRQSHAKWYDEQFTNIPEVSFLKYNTQRTCAYHLYPLLFDMEQLSCDKKTLFAAFKAEGIGVQVHYIPVNQHPYYRRLGYNPVETPKANSFYRKEISIPLFSSMKESDREDVLAAVNKILKAFRR